MVFGTQALENLHLNFRKYFIGTLNQNIHIVRNRTNFVKSACFYQFETFFWNIQKFTLKPIFKKTFFRGQKLKKMFQGFFISSKISFLDFQHSKISISKFSLKTNLFEERHERFNFKFKYLIQNDLKYAKNLRFAYLPEKALKNYSKLFLIISS